MQQTINERLKILIPALNLSARAFSKALDVSESTTRNYLDKGTKPSTDYIELIANHFKSVNIDWLITGRGGPFTTNTEETGDAVVSSVKNNYGNNVGANKGGTVTQHHGPPTGPDERDNKLALAEKEIQHLRAQLATKDVLLAAKDETIAVLKTAFNRPN